MNISELSGSPYLNSPGHGANFHTGEFIQGYNDGFNGCGGNQEPPDHARSHQYNYGQLDCYYRRIVLGTNTPDYIARCKEGTHHPQAEQRDNFTLLEQ